MRISQLSLAGQEAWPELHVDQIDQRLNVFFATPRAGKSTIAQLIGHLLYGKTSLPRKGGSPWQIPLDPSLQSDNLSFQTEGSIHVDSPLGSFVMRRQNDGSPLGRLTIAATDGTSVDNRTVQSLLASQSPRLLSRLYAVDFAESLSIDWLLHETIARRTPDANLELEFNWSLDCRPYVVPAREPSHEGATPLRASDILAQLTDGKLVQIRAEPFRQADHLAHSVVIVDQLGRRHSLPSLNAAQQDQFYLALLLALVASQAQSGVDLPLLLDEPFLRQDPASTAAMAGVLRQFACEGHQILLFTEDRVALQRFESLGVEVHHLEQLRRKARLLKEPKVTQASELPEERTLKFAPEDCHPPTRHDGDRDDLFHLQQSSSLDDFPVLGNGTQSRFVRLGIHSVDDLMAADAEETARRLNRPDITTETVAMWQSHMALMCFVPGLTLSDAQVLTAVGVHVPSDLAKADADEFYAEIDRFLSSDRGEPLNRWRSRYQRGQLSSWRCGAERHRKRWEKSRRRYSWAERAGADPESQRKNRRVG